METIHSDNKSVKGEARPKHPLNQKFPTIEAGAKAKTDYIVASKPDSYWEKLRKALGK
jgi:hypothetical protein